MPLAAAASATCGFGFRVLRVRRSITMKKRSWLASATAGVFNNGLVQPGQTIQKNNMPNSAPNEPSKMVSHTMAETLRMD